MRVLALLLLLTSSAQGSPFDLVLRTGVAQLDAGNARDEKGGGFGWNLAVGVSARMTDRIDLTARFGYSHLVLDGLDRSGRLLDLGLRGEVRVHGRLRAGVGASFVLLSTTPHEQSMSRGLGLPVHTSIEIGRHWRVGVEVEPVLFRGGFAVATMLGLELRP